MSEASSVAGPVRCAACGFWAQINASLGVCRRRAPWPTEGAGAVAHWSETLATEGCGDGAPRGERAATLGCADCAFWQQPGDGGGLRPMDFGDQPRTWWRQAGRCARHAPPPLSNPGARLVWQATHATDACGEGAPRPPAPPEGG